MSEKKQDKQKLEEDDLFKDIGDWLDLSEKEEFIIFKCIDCGCIDQVPAFIIGEFSYDLEEGEEVELECPECNGTLRVASESPEVNE
ncbi:hypothetical protein [Alkalihalobacterium alkalinitrilicum]|uniref:hypothetical protein n=1 Tax=Alkalihalobacterium alkalinitrilicum TaxID=427920 RepID=UPI00114DED4D|nr:hypothetical protein [Alkalihalobacterium alkalinitrilicum]